MKTFTSNDLESLLEHKEYPSISIYLPTHITGSDIRQNSIRLKNLLNNCRDRLESEYKQKEISVLLKPGFEHLNNSLFWKQQSKGLALFISTSFSRYFHLPLMPDEELYLGNFFYILPLIPVLIKDRTYYILLLRQKGIKLLQAAFNNINEVPLHNIPKNIDELLQFDVTEEHLQMHTTPLGKSAGSNALFHGQGNIADNTYRKKNIQRYFKEVAKGVDKQLQGQTVPLILAGVDYEQVIFRQYSSYRHLLKEGITSELGQLDNEQLQHHAWNILQSYFDKNIEDCLARYRNLVNTKMTSTNIKEILPAAYTGRIDTLIVDINKHVPGKFETQSRQVNIHQNNENGEEDLLNLAAIYSLKNDAKVCAITDKEVSGNNSLAAIFRY